MAAGDARAAAAAMPAVGSLHGATLESYAPMMAAFRRGLSEAGHVEGRNMKRRQFIALFGGMAATWTLAAQAQQPERMRRIGVLMSLATDDPEMKARLAAFLQGLQHLGWTEDRNVRIDTRSTAGDAERIRRYAAELVALAPEVILASGGQVVGGLLQATRTVPVVFTQTPDPVGAGFVASLAQPGGNATGFTQFE